MESKKFYSGISEVWLEGILYSYTQKQVNVTKYLNN